MIINNDDYHVVIALTYNLTVKQVEKVKFDIR